MVPRSGTRSGTRMKIKFIIQQQCGGQLQEIQESCAHAPVYIYHRYRFYCMLILISGYVYIYAL